MITREIDTEIQNFIANPGEYDFNEWRCYEACKKIIRRMEEEKVIPYSTEVYSQYIDYVVGKLNIDERR